MKQETAPNASVQIDWFFADLELFLDYMHRADLVFDSLEDDGELNLSAAAMFHRMLNEPVTAP